MLDYAGSSNLARSTQGKEQPIALICGGHFLIWMTPGRQFGGLHRGGASIAMADGSVRWVSESIVPRYFEAILTMAEDENLLSD